MAGAAPAKSLRDLVKARRLERKEQKPDREDPDVSKKRWLAELKEKANPFANFPASSAESFSGLSPERPPAIQKSPLSSEKQPMPMSPSRRACQVPSFDDHGSLLQEASEVEEETVQEQNSDEDDGFSEGYDELAGDHGFGDAFDSDEGYDSGQGYDSDGNAVLGLADAQPYGAGRRRRGIEDRCMANAKKRRTSVEFALKGNEGDLPADNPAAFRAYPLRAEQLRSLSWMLSQEQRRTAPRGGLLADRMGYGKTATAIGLISLGLPGVAPENECPDSYIASRATLILCPPHLVRQWELEFVKFLGRSGVEVWRARQDPGARAHRKLKWLSCAGGLKVVVLERVQDLQLLNVEDLRDGIDVVLAPSNLQSSNHYKKAVNTLGALGSDAIPPRAWEMHEDIQGSEQNNPLHGKKMEVRMKCLRWAVSAKREEILSLLKNPSSCSFPIFELFWWHRLILDEFHESDSWIYRVREMMKSVGARCRWGLSGTPPFDNFQSTCQVAELLWYPPAPHLAPTIAKMNVKIKSQGSDDKAWVEDAEKQVQLRTELEQFVDDFVRQNSSKLVDSIKLVEHRELVQHVPEERLIYRQVCHDNGLFDLGPSGYNGASLEAREALLFCCAHFDLSAKRAESAADAVYHLGEAKRERIRAVEKQLRLEASRAALFGAWPQGQRALKETGTLHPRACEFLHSLGAETIGALEAHGREVGCEVEVKRHGLHGELLERPRVVLQQPLELKEYCNTSSGRHVVKHAVAKRNNISAARILQGASGCRQHCKNNDFLRTTLAAGLGALSKLLDVSCRSLDFYEAQLRGISDSSGSVQECSICLDAMDEPQALALLPCAHVFHTACIREVLAHQNRHCPTCRAASPTQPSPMVLELSPPPQSPVSVPTLVLPQAWQKHGSKLNAVAGCLHRILADTDTRAIVFVQWEPLEDLVAAALKDHGLPFARLPRRASRGGELERFQQKIGPPVMILSLERCASGSNLTAANHVLFVHPMNAPSLQTARDYEQQAIGRVRRVGQSREAVHIWRFVARDTVEEHISGLVQGSSMVAGTETSAV